MSTARPRCVAVARPASRAYLRVSVSQGQVDPLLLLDLDNGVARAALDQPHRVDRDAPALAKALVVEHRDLPSRSSLLRLFGGFLGYAADLKITDAHTHQGVAATEVMVEER